MVWSQFSIKIFGVHFGNSVLDNSNLDKMNHSLRKKSHTSEEDGAHLRISFWRLLMNFEKPKKSDFRKTETICWRCHHLTPVYQKPQSYEDVVPEIWSETEFFFHFGPFFWLFDPLPSPLTTHKTKVFKKWKNYGRYHHVKLTQQKTRSYDVCLLRYGLLAQT